MRVLQVALLGIVFVALVSGHPSLGIVPGSVAVFLELSSIVGRGQW